MGKEVHMKAVGEKYGVCGEDEMSGAALCKRVFDFCLRLFLHFIEKSLDKIHNLKVNI